MDEDRAALLFDLADSILATSRLIHASKAHVAEGWSPLESAVMRVIDRTPGITAGAAAEATRLISSNFSRALRNLEHKGLVRRAPDAEDGRRVRLYPTDAAQENLRRLQDIWSRLLDDVVEDAEAETLIAALRRIEARLSPRPGTPDGGWQPLPGRGPGDA